MLPTVSELLTLAADAQRGALVASFRDDAGADLDLVIPCPVAGNGGTPELQRHIPHRYTDKFTGDLHVYATREDTPLAWADAVRLLAQLAPRLDCSQPAQVRVHADMLRAASNGATANNSSS
jgi:hypothetical protein